MPAATAEPGRFALVFRVCRRQPIRHRSRQRLALQFVESVLVLLNDAQQHHTNSARKWMGKNGTESCCELCRRLPSVGVTCMSLPMCQKCPGTPPERHAAGDVRRIPSAFRCVRRIECEVCDVPMPIVYRDTWPLVSACLPAAFIRMPVLPIIAAWPWHAQNVVFICSIYPCKLARLKCVHLYRPVKCLILRWLAFNALIVSNVNGSI